MGSSGFNTAGVEESGLAISSILFLPSALIFGYHSGSQSQKECFYQFRQIHRYPSCANQFHLICYFYHSRFRGGVQNGGALFSF